MDVENWNRVIGVNLTGTMLGIRTLAPLMPDHDGASIVNIGSIAGLSGHFALSYTVSKWGLRGLTRAVALELAARGIRVNIVHPGPIDTPILDGADPVFCPGQRRADAARPGGQGGRGRRRGRLPAVRPRLLPQRPGHPGRRRVLLARRRQVDHRRPPPSRTLRFPAADRARWRAPMAAAMAMPSARTRRASPAAARAVPAGRRFSRRRSIGGFDLLGQLGDAGWRSARIRAGPERVCRHEGAAGGRMATR